MSPLEGKTLLLGVSGGIASYKAAELVRLAVRRGARVRVMMTPNATRFVGPLTFQTLSGSPVATDTFDLGQESQIGHIRLADEADVVVLAPATANRVAKLAWGIADDLVATVLLATRAPVIVAPAMNVHMYEHPAVRQNIERLRALGCVVMEPESGELACGYEGPGRLPRPEHILAEAERAVTPASLAGRHVLVTAGPNREAIDPVRFISNRSSGRMGYALAVEAWRRGARVTLVSGPTALEPPYGIETVPVVSAEDTRREVLNRLRGVDVLLMAAAVADYRPVRTAPHKIRKSEGSLVLELERTADVLAAVAARRRRPLLVGFAAETENVVERARHKLREKKLDLVVANDVSRSDAGFEVETNHVWLVEADQEVELPLAPKDQIAAGVLDRVTELLRDRRARL